MSTRPCAPCQRVLRGGGGGSCRFLPSTVDISPRRHHSKRRMLCVAAGAHDKGRGGSDLNISRRSSLSAAVPVLGLLGQLAHADAAYAAPSFLESAAGGLVGNGFDLDAALAPGKPSIRSPGLSWSTAKKSKQIFYPAWMEGTWDVTAEFSGVYAPLGQRFTSSSTPGFTKASILAVADVGATPVQYKARFVDSKEEGGIVADRIYNTEQCVDAFLNRPGSVRSVEYDPVANPTRLQAVYSTPRKDTREQSEDLRKAELFINNRVSKADDAKGEFLFAEFIRQVGQAARQGSVNDYVVATRLQRGPSDAAEDGTVVVEGLQRVGAFLQPQDPAYFDVGGQAVAVYDYKLRFSRPEDSSKSSSS